jgi:trk system potassium uptake protein
LPGGIRVKKEFAVIGLGRFGGSICRTLAQQGVEVMGIDIDEDRVNEYSTIASHAVVGDTTDEKVLKNLGIRNFDHVIVAIGDNIQASILTTIMLKELGVKKVTVKAQNDYHEKVLVKIGADHVVHPERDMGRRIANNIVSNSVLDYLELSDEHSIVEIVANHRIDGHSIINLDVRAKYGINIVAIKRRDEIIVSPQASEIIYENDILIVIGADVDINRFEKKMLS